MQFQQSTLNKNLKTKNMATLQLRNSIHASFQRCALLLVSLLLTCFALPQKTQAVVPAPNGGYSGFNTAEGTNALQSLTTGVGNAAVGWHSLFSNTDGSATGQPSRGHRPRLQRRGAICSLLWGTPAIESLRGPGRSAGGAAAWTALAPRVGRRGRMRGAPARFSSANFAGNRPEHCAALCRKGKFKG